MHLILGGARSGKSSYAEQCAGKSAEVVYIATATADDTAMSRRIAHHQQSRPSHWLTIEEPFYLGECLRNQRGAEQNNTPPTLLIDCMTLWLSNWLCSKKLQGWPVERDAFLEAIQHYPGEIIIVSNEVGSGIVPLGELTREFVDQAGWLNQALAKEANEVTLVVAGCPLPLKPIGANK
jgi:adenosylcobinamide kinase/adenosylcobinamide-phosphate guanylyltransferase